MATSLSLGIFFKLFQKITVVRIWVKVALASVSFYALVGSSGGCSV